MESISKIEPRLIIGMKYMETKKRMNGFGNYEEETDTKDSKFIQLCIKQKRDYRYFDKYGNEFTIDEIVDIDELNNFHKKNGIIADYMGLFDKILSTGNIHSWSDSPFFYTTENTKEKVIEKISKYAKYHTDWNWLMPVVEKIENLGFEFFIVESRCRIAHNTDKSIETIIDFEIVGTKIEAVYKAVLDYIIWESKQQ